MKNITILVVESDVVVANNLCNTLENIGYKVLEPTINYAEALDVISREVPDIAIIDIQLLGSKSGIDLAKKINDKYSFPFIFLTGSAAELTEKDTNKVMPFAYVVKPFSEDELYATIETTLNNFYNRKTPILDSNHDEENVLFVKEKGTIIRVDFSDILYIKGAHVYIEVVLKNKKIHLIRGGLNKIIKQLNSKFIQVHRSYIINIDYLDLIDKKEMFVYNTPIPLGKKYREFIFERINLFGMKERSIEV